MARARLLVVEDEPNLLAGIRDILHLDDYSVMTAANGQKALEILQEVDEASLPDLIVSDIMMPQMDGIEFLQEVRKNVDWGGIPFIFLTAKGEKRDVHRGRQLGVDDYLIKPFDADDLLVTVQQRLLIESRRRKGRDRALNDQKRKILDILNHEFRTPLTLVVAYSDMLKDHQDQPMSEDELLMFLREINTGAERLRRLIENFILLVELETGDALKTYEWRKSSITDLPIIIKGAYNQIFGSPQMEHTCQLDVPESLPTIQGDREYILIMIRELLHNAVKFTEPNETIRLSAEAKDGKVHIHVLDSGRGIKPEEKERIWDMFYQIDREYWEDQGAGSGLAIVKSLCDIHGAQVDVESNYDEGSRFTLTFDPLSEESM